MKIKFPYNEALALATTLLYDLRSSCERIEIVGSVRRMKPEVHDLELLFIPRFQDRPSRTDLFAVVHANLADDVIDRWEHELFLKRRLNSKGSEVFGLKNKLMVHDFSGIPVDLFSTTSENWFNALVCRTGPKELNMTICNGANRMGYRWNVYGSGFTNIKTGEVRETHSEADIFEFVGLPYFAPDQRR